MADGKKWDQMLPAISDRAMYRLLTRVRDFERLLDVLDQDIRQDFPNSSARGAASKQK